ncbi:MAG TPA: hypothetical protein VMZ53_26310 [Kofleriaceae bacterium]|nr:hypothetical protein [Kofleriaceae bacterium]
MIATTRGLIVLLVLAVVFGVLVIVVGPRKRESLDRALMPRFDETRVNELVYTCPEGAETAIRDGKSWRLKTGVADAATIDATIAALRGARWHRSAEMTRAGKTSCTLTVGDAIFAIGEKLEGTEQTWILRGRRAYLVDGWVANALAPGRLALHVRRPLADAKVDPHSHGIWIDPAVVQDIRATLDALELVSLDGKEGTPGAKAFGAEQLGSCDQNRVYIRAPSGVGCVEAAAWQAIVDAEAKLAGPPEAIADRRPVPITPVKLVVSDRHDITLAGKPQIDGVVDADAERVRELLTALATPGELVPVPETAPTDALLAVAADGTQVQLHMFGNGVLYRRGEPIAIKTPSERLIARPSTDYRDPTRWREDPTTITSIKIDNVTFERGAVLGEWTRKPPAKPGATVDTALVDALAQTLAVVRAPSNAGNGKTTNGRTLKVTFTPPAGDPSTHTLVVSGAIRDGCRGRADNSEVIFPPELCTAVAALRP